MPVTLLLADDSATIQRVIEMTFAEEDVRVVTVGDGREAIERIAADPPDIVLADTSMPEKDGYEVSAFVKAEPARARIPVVLLTGAFEPVDDGRAREAGCDAVLVKPFEPKAVLGRVRELLGLSGDGGAEAPAAALSDTSAADSPAPDSTAPDSAAPGAAAPAAGGPTADPDAAAPAAADARPAAPDQESAAARDAAPGDAPRAVAGAAAAPAAADASAAAPDSESPAAQDAPPHRPADEPGVENAADPEPPAARDAPPGDAPPAAAASHAAPDPESPAAQDVGPGDAPPAAGAASPAVPAVEAPAPPSLADAFAALLAAEQGDLDRARAAYPWPRQAVPSTEDDLVERVTERVVERLSGDVTGELVSEVVARVAERLVRDQIGRIEPS